MNTISLHNLKGSMLEPAQKVYALGAQLVNTGRLQLPEANPGHDGHVSLPTLHTRLGEEVIASVEPDTVDFHLEGRGLRGSFVMASHLPDGALHKVYELTDRDGHVLLHMVMYDKGDTLGLHGWTDENVRKAA